jgi:hypothetical protein
VGEKAEKPTKNQGKIQGSRKPSVLVGFLRQKRTVHTPSGHPACYSSSLAVLPDEGSQLLHVKEQLGQVAIHQILLEFDLPLARRRVLMVAQQPVHLVPAEAEPHEHKERLGTGLEKTRFFFNPAQWVFLGFWGFFFLVFWFFVFLGCFFKNLPRRESF